LAWLINIFPFSLWNLTTIVTTEDYLGIWTISTTNCWLIN
jgi:hypothetical protein